MRQRPPGQHRPGFPVWSIVAFWLLFGVVVGNQIIRTMPAHGHSWWKMVGWQVASAMGWAVLTPVLLRLGSRLPLEPRLPVVILHLLGGCSVAALEAVPTTLFAVVFDPYTPVTAALPFADEYVSQLDHWLLLDMLLYLGLVALGTGMESRRRQVDEARLRAELAHAELRALRLELQPHFLFNALNAVAGLMRRGAAEEAETMLIGLAELLRSTLDATGRQMVTVAEEVRLAELYLDVERARFGERLTVRLEVDDDARSLPVPNLVLQPLVENAVRHGVARRAEGGTITVEAARRGDRLLLRVTDDGPGLEEATDEPGGRGLEHVTSRLEAVYEDDWELELFDRPQGGVAVEMVVPAEPRVRPVSSPKAAVHRAAVAGGDAPPAPPRQPRREAEAT